MSPPLPTTAYPHRGTESDNLVQRTVEAPGQEPHGSDGGDGARREWEGYSADILVALLDGYD